MNNSGTGEFQRLRALIFVAVQRDIKTHTPQIVMKQLILYSDPKNNPPKAISPSIYKQSHA